MIQELVFQQSYYWLPLVGFLIGLLATIVGGGGASFFPPVLILMFHIQPQVAVATSLAAAVPVGLVGTASHYRNGNVNFPIGMAFGLAGIAGALLGAGISSLLRPEVLKTAFGVYAILLAGLMLLTNKPLAEVAEERQKSYRHLSRGEKASISLFGIISGGFAGLFGTSGTAPAMAGLFILKLPLKLVIGTSVMIVLFNAISGLGSHLLLGQVDPVLTILLGTGAALGAFGGPIVLNKINVKKAEKTVKGVFILVTLLVGVLMIAF